MVRESMTKAALVLLAVVPLRAVPVPQVADGADAATVVTCFLSNQSPAGLRVSCATRAA